jgi:hypothetical protein
VLHRETFQIHATGSRRDETGAITPFEWLHVEHERERREILGVRDGGITRFHVQYLEKMVIDEGSLEPSIVSGKGYLVDVDAKPMITGEDGSPVSEDEGKVVWSDFFGKKNKAVAGSSGPPHGPLRIGERADWMTERIVGPLGDAEIADVTVVLSALRDTSQGKAAVFDVALTARSSPGGVDLEMKITMEQELRVSDGARLAGQTRGTLTMRTPKPTKDGMTIEASGELMGEEESTYE